MRLMDIAPTQTLVTPAAPLPGWGDRFSMPLFKPGVQVRRGGTVETVSHIALRRLELAVYLVGHENSFTPEQLHLEPTVFSTQRMPEQR